MHNNNKGFSVIEVVIVIVAIIFIGSLLAIAFSAEIKGTFTTAPPTIPAGSQQRTAGEAPAGNRSDPLNVSEATVERSCAH